MASPLRTAWEWGEMIKFSHSIFALPLALLAAFLAARPQLPHAGQIGLIVLCMIGARSAAMTFNRIADARIDAANPRTAGRAIPRGRIGPAAAWAFFTGAALLFAAGCAGFWLAYANAWPLILGGPVLLALCGYSYTKRFTRWSHVLLGGAIATAPLAAWIAISPHTLGAAAIVLMLGGALWIAGFDIIYACQDVGFDRAAGLHSLPARVGVGAALWIARGFHLLTAAALATVGLLTERGVLYFVGVGCVAVLLAIENALVRADDLRRVNLAFFTINGVVGVLLGVLGVADVVLG
ncbi:4-hydroxybenzoate octaprenyltransferase [Phycisphaerae bacterium RAS1]|nr:4-hydroxybenzoate octaprenyltransferase [Phycisphaerae bacterium RAS1]